MGRIPRAYPALFLAVGLLVAAPAAAHAKPTFRIVDGRQGDIARTPWMASLVQTGKRANGGQFCGGAVVAPQAIVTAAHCVVDATPRDFEVVTGRTSLGETGGQRIGVAAIRVHPGYSDQTSHDDIAVVLLKAPTIATPIPVAQPGDFALADAGRTVTIAGWGTTGGDTRPSDTLLEGTQVVRSSSRCKRSWRSLYDAKTQFCAVGANGGRPDTCPGDSGGPLTGAGPDGIARLVGIVSFGGQDCGVPEPPSVYTRVSAFASFVAQQAASAPPVTPVVTPPITPIQSAAVSVRFGRMECGLTCRVDVVLSGEGASRVSSVAVRVIGTGFDRTVAARRLDGRTWRSQIDLPFGRDRLVATAFDSAGKPTGNKPKTTVNVVPAK